MPGCELRPGRILRSGDFERLLRSSPAARTEHFALHHAAARPGKHAWKLSTGMESGIAPAVDESQRGVPDDMDALDAGRIWLGAVLPRRHARRAVTRNLLRRAIRQAGCEHAGRLSAGMWLVRLRAPLARAEFPSADSPALRRVVRLELADLFGRAIAR